MEAKVEAPAAKVEKAVQKPKEKTGEKVEAKKEEVKDEAEAKAKVEAKVEAKAKVEEILKEQKKDEKNKESEAKKVDPPEASPVESPAAPVEPSLPSMLERYVTAESETRATGSNVHVAQFQDYDGIPFELRSAMSQLPDDPPLQSPLHPNGPKLKLRELRAKLHDLNRPTIGTLSELATQYDYALRQERAKTQSWDVTSQAWVPIPSM